MNDRHHLVFATTSVLLLVVLVLVSLKDQRREDRRFQREYHQLVRQAGPGAEQSEASGGAGPAQEWIAQDGARVERCVACHIGAAQPALAGARVPFALHTETAHAPGDLEQFGCVACHGGLGVATNRLDAHERWSPLLPATHVEAGCGGCHQGLDVSEAPALVRGRRLIRSLGCFNCHDGADPELSADKGPPLDVLSAKVTREWLRRWLENPRQVDPNGTMPNFQLQPPEIEALADYLLSLRSSADVQQAIAQTPVEITGDAEAGAVLFRVSMCISCHTMEGKGAGSAQELAQIGTKASAVWLLAFMKETHRLHPNTRMPAYGFSQTELRDLVTYMKDELRDFDAPSEVESPPRPSAPMIEEGRKTFLKYGCVACHSSADADRGELGPDLTGIADARTSALDFGPRTDLPPTLPAWLEAKVTDPRSFGSTTKMPRYELTVDDTKAVVTALLAMSQTPATEAYQLRPSHAPVPGPPPPSGEVGRLFAKYRCLSCHVVGGAGVDLSTIPLTFEGSKANTDWLAAYLQLPQTIFPILTQRMPVLKMTAEEARRIATYISDVYVDDSIPGAASVASSISAPESVDRGEQLFARKACKACHILGESGGYVGPPLNDAAERFKPGWIAYWLEDPQRWQPDARCPNFGLASSEIQDLTAFMLTKRPSRQSRSSGGGQGLP